MSAAPNSSPVPGKVRHLRLAAREADLVLGLVDGQPWAQGAAWDQYSGLVRGMLRRAVGPVPEIDDLVQESFLRFFRSVHNLRDASAVRSFLIGIVVRVAATELRRRRLRGWLRLTSSGATPEPTMDVDEPAREALRRLGVLLDRLGVEARLCFVLRHVEGLELEEVAAALGISLATAKRRLAKVRSQVAALIAADPVLCDWADQGDGDQGGAHEP